MVPSAGGRASQAARAVIVQSDDRLPTNLPYQCFGNAAVVRWVSANVELPLPGELVGRLTGCSGSAAGVHGPKQQTFDERSPLGGRNREYERRDQPTADVHHRPCRCDVERQQRVAGDRPRPRFVTSEAVVQRVVAGAAPANAVVRSLVHCPTKAMHSQFHAPHQAVDRVGATHPAA